MVESQASEIMKNSIKLSVVGNVDSGKSTLVGVLSKGENDDGRGAARQRVFNYTHEQVTGRTTSVTQEIMGFDYNDNPYYPTRFNQKKNVYWCDVMKKSKKIINFLDLCGHEKYLKTTIYGMMSYSPDYAMIIVGSNSGLIGMSKEHIMITQALQIPYFVVVTKIDMCPPNVYKSNLQELKQHLTDAQRKGFLIGPKTEFEQVLILIQIKKLSVEIQSDKNPIIPIFNVSSVTKDGLDKLNYFLALLKNQSQINKHILSPDDPTQFDITDNFQITGLGLVVNGLVRAGTIKVNQQLLLGPDVQEKFILISVKSIHQNRLMVQEVPAGQICTLQIKAVKTKEEVLRKNFRKGIVLLDKDIGPKSYKYMVTEVQVLHHSTTIKHGYQAVFHQGVIRQVVRLEKILKVQNQSEQDFMRTGTKGLVVFKFIYKPEYLRKDGQFLLREGQTRIVGNIKYILDKLEDVDTLDLTTL